MAHPPLVIPERNPAHQASLARDVERVLRILLLVVLAGAVSVGYASAAGWLVVWVGAGNKLLLPVAGLVFAAIVGYAVVRRGRHVRGAFEILALGVLIAWGFAANHVFGPECVRGACDDDLFRYLAEPYAFALLALHAVTVLAYAVSRRRPEALHPSAELLLHASLIAGIILHTFVAIQFGPALMLGFLAPLAMPALAPVMVIVLYAVELVTRLRRRGAEQPLTLDEARPFSGICREPSVDPVAPSLRIHRVILARALVLSPVLLGVYAVVTAVVFRDWSAAVRVFTQTCDHTFSQLPVVQQHGDCHYLCTVAARGHAALVRPERIGRRGGQRILVNRQLAVANAFEELLHTRWPRFGGIARRVYDRLGLPVSRWIRSRWMADLVYLAMKPFEWLFYLALVFLDPATPESRIDRMYR